jgi:hypothetical protein
LIVGCNDAHVQIQQVEDIRLQRHPRGQVLYLEREFVDAKPGDVEQYVGLIMAAPAPRPGRRIAIVIPRREGSLVVGLAQAGAPRFA